MGVGALLVASCVSFGSRVHIDYVDFIRAGGLD